jgi:hypothetical protein
MMLAAPATTSAAALVALAPSGSWASTPLHAASPPGDFSRLFVVERGGGVRMVKDGVLQKAPFLTVPNVDTEGERGLLSIAFAPDYATSGLFYVFTVAKVPDAFGGGSGELRVVEYRRSASNPDLADPASARLVLSQTHSGATNHNGGQLAFGPDGLLYITMGDAAVSSNAQTLTNDLGKILRIDPRLQAGGAPFGIPSSNPFSGAGVKPEIYALGLRNPFRASFGPNGDLILPDVGQSAWEEVNLGKATGTPAASTLAGANLGWPTCEGVCTTPQPGFTDPVFQYGHGASGETTGCAIIGGYVVRDPTLAGLSGRYLYGDLCRPDLRTLDLNIPGADPRPAGVSLPAEASSLLGFGEDGRGCVYVMTDATAYRVASAPTDGPACPIPPPSSAKSDTTPPKLSLSGAHRQRLRRVLRVYASCDEACALRATAALAAGGAKASTAAKPFVTRRSGGPGKRVRLPVKIGRKPYLRAKRALKQGRKAFLRVKVIATDSSANRSRKYFRIRLVLSRP